MTTLGRRRFVGGSFVMGVGLLGRTPAVGQPSRVAKIGVLTESWGPTPAVVGLRDGLVELGAREDKDFTIGVRFTAGNTADLPTAAGDLARHRVDVLVTTETGTAPNAARMATRDIPIVFIGSGDPVGLGLVQSLARPGGNVTGVADLDIDLVPKRMGIFRELVPRLRRVLLPYDATNAEALAQLAVHRDAARRLGLILVEKPVRGEDEARAITGLQKGDADGIFSMRFLTSNLPGFVLELASRSALPTMFASPYFVERGGLASYAANTYELGKQAARLVHKILKGVRPADLPVEQPLKFELVLNAKTAKALGLAVPPALLVRADRVIE